MEGGLESEIVTYHVEAVINIAVCHYQAVSLP